MISIVSVQAALCPSFHNSLEEDAYLKKNPTEHMQLLIFIPHLIVPFSYYLTRLPEIHSNTV